MTRVINMKRQLLTGFFVLLSCLFACVASQQERYVAGVQTVDTFEQSADMAIEAQAHEIRNRFAMKSPPMKRVDIVIDAVAVASPVVRHESQKQDTKTETIYDFYARVAGGMPATTTFLRWFGGREEW